MNSITIRRPDDWHLHLRDEEMLATTVPHSAEVFRAGHAEFSPPGDNRVFRIKLS